MQSKILSTLLCNLVVASFVFADTDTTNSSELKSAREQGGGIFKIL